MKRIVRVVSFLLIAALACVPFAEAQQSSAGAATTQTGATGLAGATCVNAVGTNSAQQTITIPGPGGANSVYIDYLSAAIYGTAAIATSATVPVVTTTNISGTPTWPFATAGQSTTAAGSVIQASGLPGPLGIPLKAVAGASPTIVGPAAVSTYFQYLTACYHVAP